MSTCFFGTKKKKKQTPKKREAYLTMLTYSRPSVRLGTALDIETSTQRAISRRYLKMWNFRSTRIASKPITAAGPARTNRMVPDTPSAIRHTNIFHALNSRNDTGSDTRKKAASANVISGRLTAAVSASRE